MDTGADLQGHMCTLYQCLCELSMFMRAFETPVDTYGRFSVLAHDDAGVGTADEVAAVNLGDGDCHFRVHV
jgi:hypothetical protein